MRNILITGLTVVLTATLGASAVVVAPDSSMAVAAPAQSSQRPQYSEGFITSRDGTRLWTQVWRPAELTDDERTPVVLIVTPYATPHAVSADYGGHMLAGVMARGWTLAQVSLRGYAESEGCGDLFGPAEQMDAVAAVEWADSQSWSNGKVGMYGISYDGVAQLMALTHDARVEAAVMASPVLSLYDGLVHDGVHYQTWREIPPAYTFIQAFSGSMPKVPACMAEAFVHDRTDTERDTPFFAVRDFVGGVQGTDAPVLWTRGFWEDLGAHNVLPVWSTLQGDRRGTFGHYQHFWATRHDQLELELDFLAQHLEDAAPPEEPPVRVQDNEGYWRAEDAWPPTDAAEHTIELNGGTYVDILGADYVEYAADAIWTVTEPAEETVRLSGPSRVRLTADFPIDLPALPSSHDDPRVIVTLYDVEPDGTATLVTRGANLLRSVGEVEVHLHAKDWVMRPGHRLAVAISGAEDATYEGGTTGLPITVSDAELALSLLTYTRDRFLDGGAPSAAVIPRSTTVTEHILEGAAVEAALPPTQPHPCAEDGDREDCPTFAAVGAPASPGNVEVLLDHVIENLQPHLFFINSGVNASFEVPESDEPVTLSIIADPDRAANIDVHVHDANGGYVGGSAGTDLRREGAVLPALAPGTYRLFIRGVIGFTELTPPPPPTDVHVQVVLHRR